MITERIKITNSGSGMNEALSLTESAAGNLSDKDKLRLRLLAEEMLSMVRAITGECSADFWLEIEGTACTLNLEAKSELDYSKRKELLSVSTSGKNTEHLGMMEKIRSIVEAGLYGLEEGFKIQAEYGTGMFVYGSLGMPDDGLADAMYEWSMRKYKDEIEANREEEQDSYDELEKSIIANIADDVQVGIKKDSVKLVVVKKF